MEGQTETAVEPLGMGKEAVAMAARGEALAAAVMTEGSVAEV